MQQAIPVHKRAPIPNPQVGRQERRRSKWLDRQRRIPPGTATAQFNADPGRIADADRDEVDIDIMDWLGGNRSVDTTEEVIGLGRYTKTLTVLTCPSLVDETYQNEDEDEEDDLEERWTPRFRR